MQILKILALFVFLSIRVLGQETTISSEIKSLTNDSLKSSYLEGIFYEDQKIRSEWLESINADSITLRNVLKKVGYVDSINLLKIDGYLNFYQYPNRSKHSDLAVLTPWLVIHHATYNDVRIRNYPVLLNAYSAEDVREEELKMYMARTLSIEERKEYDFFYKKNMNVLKKKMKKLYDRYSSRK